MPTGKNYLLSLSESGDKLIYIDPDTGEEVQDPVLRAPAWRIPTRKDANPIKEYLGKNEFWPLRALIREVFSIRASWRQVTPVYKKLPSHLSEPTDDDRAVENMLCEHVFEWALAAHASGTLKMKIVCGRPFVASSDFVKWALQSKETPWTPGSKMMFDLAFSEAAKRKGMHPQTAKRAERLDDIANKAQLALGEYKDLRKKDGTPNCASIAEHFNEHSFSIWGKKSPPLKGDALTTALRNLVRDKRIR